MLTGGGKIEWLGKLTSRRVVIFAAVFYIAVKLPLAVYMNFLEPEEQPYIGVVSKELRSLHPVLPLLELSKRPNENGALVMGFVSTPLLMLTNDRYLGLRLTAMSMSYATCLAWTWIAATHVSPLAGLLTALLLTLPPPFAIIDNLTCIGNHPETNLIIVLSLLVLLKLTRQDKKGFILSFILGFLVGFGMFFDLIYSFGGAAILVSWFIVCRGLPKVRFLFLFIIGCIVGFSPWIAGSMIYHYQNFSIIGDNLPALSNRLGFQDILRTMKFEHFYHGYLDKAGWIFTRNKSLQTVFGTISALLITLPAVVLIKYSFRDDNSSEPLAFMEDASIRKAKKRIDAAYIFPFFYILFSTVALAFSDAPVGQPPRGTIVSAQLHDAGTYLFFRYLSGYFVVGLAALGMVGGIIAEKTKSNPGVRLVLLLLILVVPVSSGLNGWFHWMFNDDGRERESIYSLSRSGVNYSFLGAKINWDGRGNVERNMDTLNKILGKRPGQANFIISGFVEGIFNAPGKNYDKNEVIRILKKYDGFADKLRPVYRCEYCRCIVQSMRERVYDYLTDEEWVALEDSVFNEILPVCNSICDLEWSEVLMRSQSGIRNRHHHFGSERH